MCGMRSTLSYPLPLFRRSRPEDPQQHALVTYDVRPKLDASLQHAPVSIITRKKLFGLTPHTFAQTLAPSCAVESFLRRRECQRRF
jgi:hypothetical protein